MAKRPTKKTTSPADDLVRPVSRQLKESELEQVTGGKVKMSDILIVKQSDKSST